MEQYGLENSLAECPFKIVKSSILYVIKRNMT